MNIQNYLEYVNSPWGKLFYKLVWNKLSFSKMKILDFGSGFGLTSNFLASDNDVVAIEPNQQMLEHRFCDNNYLQITGGTETLSAFENDTFDVIISHNVLEYVDDKKEVIEEFQRLLKKDGVISIIKHNTPGKIMHKAVFEYNVDGALDIINGNNSLSENFGIIKEYSNEELKSCFNESLIIKNIYGIRTFYGLQDNNHKFKDDWVNKMFVLETSVENKKPFQDIAFFHHLIINKVR